MASKTAEPFNYEARQLDRLNPAEFYSLQISSDAGGQTKWLTISREQLDAIRKILTGVSDEWPEYGREDVVYHDTEDMPAVVIRPGAPIHVFGAVNVITGKYGAEEKLTASPDDE